MVYSNLLQLLQSLFHTYTGITGVIVGHPFDTVKVRLQTQNPIIYKGTFDCFAQIIKKESVCIYKLKHLSLYN